MLWTTPGAWVKLREGSANPPGRCERVSHLLELSQCELADLKAYDNNPDPRYVKALRLEKTLYAKTGIPSNLVDILSLYRLHLDGLGIDSENEEGWPTDIVYDESTIDEFVKTFKEGGE